MNFSNSVECLGSAVLRRQNPSSGLFPSKNGFTSIKGCSDSGHHVTYFALNVSISPAIINFCISIDLCVAGFGECEFWHLSFPFIRRILTTGNERRGSGVSNLGRNARVVQVGHQEFLELESCVAKMRFDRPFRRVQTAGYRFDRELLKVINNTNTCLRVFVRQERVFFRVSRSSWRRMFWLGHVCVYDAMFVREMSRLGVVSRSTRHIFVVKGGPYLPWYH